MLKLNSVIKYKGDEYIDDDKPLKSTLTDFINDNYLKYNHNSLRLLNLIYREIGTFLNPYGLKLIFKGGNVMNLINNNVMKYFPPNADDLICEIFSKFLKKSDNDFTILINPNIRNFKTIFNKVSMELLNALDNIRTEIEKSPEYYFDIYNLNKNNLIKLYDNLMIDLNDLEIGQYNKISMNAITDKLIMLEKKNNPKSNVLVYDIGKDKHQIYNSLNLSLSWKDYNNNKIEFNLLRSKINFLLNNKKNVSGELIDISISSDNDYELKKLKGKNKFDNYFKKNIDKIYNSQYKFNYYIINTYYIVKDLYKILFINNKFPWEDPKYKKRLARFVYFMFLFLLDDNPINKSTLFLIKDIFKIYKNNIQKNKYTKVNVDLLDIVSIDIKNINNIRDVDNVKLKQFKDYFIEYVNSVINIIDRILDYQKGNEKFNEKKIYKINIK
jgi:hypothetical protein